METIRETVRRNVVHLVESATISQKKIASAVGVSEPTIYRWKSGENAPSLDNLDKLAEVLGVNPLVFFSTEEKDAIDPLNIIRQIGALGPTELEILKETLETLSKPLGKAKEKKA